LGGCWLESAGEAVEVGAGELPLERGGDLLVAAAELEQGALKGVEVGEVVGGDDLALHDGEVDFGLVEPAGVDWGVDEGQVRPGALEAVEIERLPRCAEPLSTITNTRWALL
jgi:hypothetical protein